MWHVTYIFPAASGTRNMDSRQMKKSDSELSNTIRQSNMTQSIIYV